MNISSLLRAALISLAIISSSISSLVSAESLNEKEQQQVQDIIKRYLNDGFVIEQSHWAANKQLIEVILSDMSVFYLTPDMKYASFDGNLFLLGETGAVNLTQRSLQPLVAKSESIKNKQRQKLMANIKDQDTVVFKAKGEQKGLINVFTDIDCGYCRKLHKEVPALNEQGITVRYLAYPRAGERDDEGNLTGSFKKIKSVWCDEDRPAAMTLAKKRRNIKDNLDCEAPIMQQMAVGAASGVRGTPAIVIDDGRFIGGYLPAEDLVKYILDK